MFEMIQKVQTLQKRLIGKTEVVVEKDLLIQEKEKLYIELKVRVLNRCATQRCVLGGACKARRALLSDCKLRLRQLYDFEHGGDYEQVSVATLRTW